MVVLCKVRVGTKYSITDLFALLKVVHNKSGGHQHLPELQGPHCYSAQGYENGPPEGARHQHFQVNHSCRWCPQRRDQAHPTARAEHDIAHPTQAEHFGSHIHRMTVIIISNSIE